MPLALFDLDNTLLGGDSDHAWGAFLVAQGHVDGARYQRENDRFYADYAAGTLDIRAYCDFVFEVLARTDLETLLSWRRDFMATAIEPMLQAAAFERIEWHRQQGHELVVITATNRFVTEPIVARYGIPHLIATEPERDAQGRFTGRLSGEPCFQAGKIVRLEAWAAANHQTLDEAWFYSDSRNDLPLLQRVAHPVAVDPDPVLAAMAAAQGWPVMSFRTPRTSI